MDIVKAFLGGLTRRPKKRGRDDPDPDEGRLVVRRDDHGEEIIKEAPMEIDGRVMTAGDFVRYVETIEFAQPLPTRIFLHHTWRPTPETWRGHETMLAMKAYYERQQWRDSDGRLHEGWTAGPHIFVAPDGIWLFSDLAHDGVGVYGHNYRTRHIEMVGNYDGEPPSGTILSDTVAVIGALSERLGLRASELGFHRDFSNKSCPGWAVTKAWLIPQVERWIDAYRRGRESDDTLLRQALARLIADQLVQTNPQAALAREAAQRGLLGALTREVPMEIDDQAYMVQLFAEALVVPVDQWDRVESLSEYEARHEGTSDADEGARDLGAAGHRATGVAGGIVAPPTDPFDFDGNIR